MKKSTRRGSLFGKLIGSYVIFSMAAILLLIVAVLISFVFSYGNVLQENFPGITVGADGTIQNLDGIRNMNGWVEKLDAQYHVETVYGRKQTTQMAYTKEQLLDAFSLKDDVQQGIQNGKKKYWMFGQKAGEFYYLIFYPEAQFSTVYNFDPQKVLYTNTGSRMLYVVFLLLVLDVVGVSLYILRKIKRPLDTIIAGMKRVEQGEEQVVIPPQKEKEFTEIGNAFNNMTKQLAAQRAENEKMAQSRQKMLLELSHDIKTPVATIKSYIYALQEQMVPDVDVPKYYETIARKADRVNTLSEDLFMLLKMESAEYQLNLQTLDLSELTRQICAEYYEEITNAGFSFSVEIPEEAVWIQGDGRLLIRVITNLLTNAKKYNCTGNKIALSITQDNGKTAVLCVKDDGQAIPPEIRDTMFCAFVRGESARRSTGGTGLGLAIAQEIMEKHQGELFYIRETGENIFSIRIPNPIKCESIS